MSWPSCSSTTAWNCETKRSTMFRSLSVLRPTRTGSCGNVRSTHVLFTVLVIRRERPVAKGRELTGKGRAREGKPDAGEGQTSRAKADRREKAGTSSSTSRRAEIDRQTDRQDRGRRKRANGQTDGRI